MKVLMVCLGNICRSPTAHGVFQSRVIAAGLENIIEVDSAGTADYHVGSKPDSRSMAVALKNNYDLSAQRARQVCQQDFEQFDYVLAMDRQNLADLRSQCPSAHRSKLFLFLDFGSSKIKEVPDPYYGGDQGFEKVLALVEDAADGLLAHIKERDLA
ncbi:MAG: low molecular weight protein-tyrosine-phosphatase [Pseudohongiellaceae bacterium]|nr:low molecular weight protein-tyrosine-phosphatase [Pseudohongiellaceae bacterium]